MNTHYLIFIICPLLIGCVNNSMFRKDLEQEPCVFRNITNIKQANAAAQRAFDPETGYSRQTVREKLPTCEYNEKDYHESFGACRPRNKPGYKRPNPFHGECRHRALQVYFSPQDNRNYHLGFIEYDDQGQLYKRAQLNNVTNYVAKLKSENKVILVVYVHGWHHTAGFNVNKNDDDSDIEKFRELLEQLSQSETVITYKHNNADNTEKRKPRSVVGVYIGWRGESTNLFGLSEATFWPRKNIAHRIGQLGASESLLKLEKIIYPGRNSVSDTNGESEKSHMIIIGHSFGAALVASALQKTLVDRHLSDTARFSPGRDRNSGARDTAASHSDARELVQPRFTAPIRGFAALTVLINPAFEAIRFATLFDISQNYDEVKKQCTGYSEKQTPRVVILTSRDDLPTSFAFPLGRAFGTFFESHREYYRDLCKIDSSAGIETLKNVRLVENGEKVTDLEPVLIDQGDANMTAIGHYRPYITHALKARKDSLLRASIERDETLKQSWESQKNGARLCFEHVALTHLGKNDPFNPYLNIRVDGDIIRHHNDIWGTRLQSFIQVLIKLTTTTRTNRKSGVYDENCYLTLGSSLD